MPERHDTRTALSPVGSEEYRCPAHEGCMDRLYDAVNGRMSRGQCMWTFGVLSVVAATFGLALWAWTGNRCDKVETEIQTIQVRAERITADLEHIKAAQEEQKAEGKQLRADMMTEFRRLTDVVKHAP